MKLKGYMDKVKSIYQDYSVDYIKAADAINALNDAIPAIQNDRMLTSEGKQARVSDAREAIKKHEAIIRALKEEADASKERIDYLQSLNVLLQRAIHDLKADLGK